MPREKVGITLTENTLQNLDKICKVVGLSKSQAISLAINTYFFEKLKKEDMALK